MLGLLCLALMKSVQICTAISSQAAKFSNLVASAAGLYRLASVGAERTVCGLINLKLKVAQREKWLVGRQFGAWFCDAAL